MQFHFMGEDIGRDLSTGKESLGLELQTWTQILDPALSWGTWLTLSFLTSTAGEFG